MDRVRDSEKIMYGCYICGKIIKNEHFFLVRFNERSRVMCRKCGKKYRKTKSLRGQQNENMDSGNAREGRI